MLAPPLRKGIGEKTGRLHDFFYDPRAHSLQIVFAGDDPLKTFEAFIPIARKFDLTVVAAKFTSRPDEGDDWSVMVKYHAGLNPDAIGSELLSVRGIKYVAVGRDDNGLLINRFHFPLLDPAGDRAYVISAETLTRVFDRMRHLFGTGGDVMIYEQAETVGAHEVEEMAKLFGKDSLVPHLRQMPYLLQMAGVGKPELVSLNLEPLEVVLRVRDNVECAGKKSLYPYSAWVRGQLAGFVSTLLATPCKAEETKCEAMGHQYCEFRITAK